MRYFKLLLLCLILSFQAYGQSTTTVNVRSLKTHYGYGAASTVYSGNANNHVEFDYMVDPNSPGTTIYIDTTVDMLSLQGPRGGGAWNPPYWDNEWFAIVYHGWVKPNKTGTYRFRTYTDDSHEFMIKGIGKNNDIVTAHYGWNQWAYGTATLDKDTWYEFEYRIQNGFNIIYFSLTSILGRSTYWNLNL